MQDTGNFLRTSTQAAHRALEATPLARALMSPDLTLAAYLDILCVWAQAWQVVESAIDASAPRTQCLGLLPAPRAHRARQDLAALQPLLCVRPTDAVCPPTQMPDLTSADSAADLLGMCYVVQGATLGGKVIARHLQQVLALAPYVGHSFFCAEDLDAPGWSQWLRGLNELVRTHQDQQAALAGAERTFAFLQRIFAEAEVRRTAYQEAA